MTNRPFCFEFKNYGENVQVFIQDLSYAHVDNILS